MTDRIAVFGNVLHVPAGGGEYARRDARAGAGVGICAGIGDVAGEEGDSCAIPDKRFSASGNEKRWTVVGTYPLVKAARKTKRIRRLIMTSCSRS
jgi:hypothetical protein